MAKRILALFALTIAVTITTAEEEKKPVVVFPLQWTWFQGSLPSDAFVIDISEEKSTLAKNGQSVQVKPDAVADSLPDDKERLIVLAAIGRDQAVWQAAITTIVEHGFRKVRLFVGLDCADSSPMVSDELVIVAPIGWELPTKKDDAAREQPSTHLLVDEIGLFRWDESKRVAIDDPLSVLPYDHGEKIVIHQWLGDGDVQSLIGVLIDHGYTNVFLKLKDGC
jgi:hypothetical protein